MTRRGFFALLAALVAGCSDGSPLAPSVPETVTTCDGAGILVS